MTNRIFRNTDYNHVAMSGQVGALISVLDSILINGIALPSVTSITRSGSIATITFAAPHGLVKTAKISVSGCTQTEYNGSFSATVASSTTLTYTVSGTPATPATGSPSASLPGAGWTKEYTGTNKAVYKQGTGSNGRYLRIDDSNATNSRIVAYESMSDVDTGTGPMPTAAQLSGGGYFLKSSTASSTERDWVAIASEKFFALFCNQSGTVSGSSCLIFGDVPSEKSGDTYNTFLSCGINTTVSAANYPFYSSGTYSAAGVSGKWIQRAYTGAGGSTLMNSFGLMAHAYQMASIGNSAAMPFPDTIGGKLFQSPIALSEASCIRAIVPGLWTPCHSRPLTHLDTFDGVGDLSGKIFQVVDFVNNGQIFLEISDTVS